MRRQQLTEAQIAALFDPPTDRRELVRHCDVRPESIDDYLISGQNRRRHAAELQDRLRLRPFGRRPACELVSSLLPYAIESDRLALLAELDDRTEIVAVEQWPALKAHHAMDLPFVFDNTETADTTAGATGARELAARMADTWIAFARHGRPDNPAIPEWPAYTQAERATMQRRSNSLHTDAPLRLNPAHRCRTATVSSDFLLARRSQTGSD